MKTASEVAEGIVKSLPQRGDIEGLRGSLADKITQALTAYAEERVKAKEIEVVRSMIRSFGKRIDEIKNKARAEALQEAAKVCDEEFGEFSNHEARATGAFLADAIRALKEGS